MYGTALTCPDNQWPAADFERNVSLTLKDSPSMGMTKEEMRELYLLMWLELSHPAGNA
jgi:hypothetical protein